MVEKSQNPYLPKVLCTQSLLCRPESLFEDFRKTEFFRIVSELIVNLFTNRQRIRSFIGYWTKTRLYPHIENSRDAWKTLFLDLNRPLKFELTDDRISILQGAEPRNSPFQLPLGHSTALVTSEEYDSILFLAKQNLFQSVHTDYVTGLTWLTDFIFDREIQPFINRTLVAQEFLRFYCQRNIDRFAIADFFDSMQTLLQSPVLRVGAVGVTTGVLSMQVDGIRDIVQTLCNALGSTRTPEQVSTIVNSILNELPSPDQALLFAEVFDSVTHRLLIRYPQQSGFLNAFNRLMDESRFCPLSVSSQLVHSCVVTYGAATAAPTADIHKSFGLHPDSDASHKSRTSKKRKRQDGDGTQSLQPVQDNADADTDADSEDETSHEDESQLRASTAARRTNVTDDDYTSAWYMKSHVRNVLVRMLFASPDAWIRTVKSINEVPIGIQQLMYLLPRTFHSLLASVGLENQSQSWVEQICEPYINTELYFRHCLPLLESPTSYQPTTPMVTWKVLVFFATRYLLGWSRDSVSKPIETWQSYALYAFMTGKPMECSGWSSRHREIAADLLAWMHAVRALYFGHECEYAILKFLYRFLQPMSVLLSSHTSTVNHPEWAFTSRFEVITMEQLKLLLAGDKREHELQAIFHNYTTRPCFPLSQASYSFSSPTLLTPRVPALVTVSSLGTDVPLPGLAPHVELTSDEVIQAQRDEELKCLADDARNDVSDRERLNHAFDFFSSSVPLPVPTLPGNDEWQCVLFRRNSNLAESPTLLDLQFTLEQMCGGSAHTHIGVTYHCFYVMRQLVVLIPKQLFREARLRTYILHRVAGVLFPRFEGIHDENSVFRFVGESSGHDRRNAIRVSRLFKRVGPQSLGGMQTDDSDEPASTLLDCPFLFLPLHSHLTQAFFSCNHELVYTSLVALLSFISKVTSHSLLRDPYDLGLVRPSTPMFQMYLRLPALMYTIADGNLFTLQMEYWNTFHEKNFIFKSCDERTRHSFSSHTADIRTPKPNDHVVGLNPDSLCFLVSLYSFLLLNEVHYLSVTVARLLLSELDHDKQFQSARDSCRNGIEYYAYAVLKQCIDDHEKNMQNHLLKAGIISDNISTTEDTNSNGEAESTLDRICRSEGFETPASVKIWSAQRKMMEKRAKSKAPKAIPPEPSPYIRLRWPKELEQSTYARHNHPHVPLYELIFLPYLKLEFKRTIFANISVYRQYASQRSDTKSKGSAGSKRPPMHVLPENERTSHFDRSVWTDADFFSRIPQSTVPLDAQRRYRSTTVDPPSRSQKLNAEVFVSRARTASVNSSPRGSEQPVATKSDWEWEWMSAVFLMCEHGKHHALERRHLATYNAMDPSSANSIQIRAFHADFNSIVYKPNGAALKTLQLPFSYEKTKGFLFRDNDVLIARSIASSRDVVVTPLTGLRTLYSTTDSLLNFAMVQSMVFPNDSSPVPFPTDNAADIKALQKLVFPLKVATTGDVSPDIDQLFEGFLTLYRQRFFGESRVQPVSTGSNNKTNSSESIDPDEESVFFTSTVSTPSVSSASSSSLVPASTGLPTVVSSSLPSSTSATAKPTVSMTSLFSFGLPPVSVPTTSVSTQTSSSLLHSTSSLISKSNTSTLVSDSNSLFVPADNRPPSLSALSAYKSAPLPLLNRSAVTFVSTTSLKKAAQTKQRPKAPKTFWHLANTAKS